MKFISKITTAFLLLSFLSACENKPKPIVEKDTPDSNISLETKANKESVEGLYETRTEPGASNDCKISVEITKTKNGYTYFLNTKLRKLKGKATFITNESGEKVIVLEDIPWDEFEGDISNEGETDSIESTESKEVEIPVGIGANYVKDTLTIQNYGNSMNSYTKLSECGRKYIQLIKK